MMKPLFILEMANNHNGSVDHAIKIIREMANVTRNFPFDFAIKLQFRHLDTFIHPDYKDRKDIKYVKRFLDTELTPKQFKQIREEIGFCGFKAICTPFDEISVDLIEELRFDYIKIASCSLTDWPLLERIVQSNKPIIASTAGSSLEEIDRVVSFFQHRHKEFSLLHCVGEYPVLREHFNLQRISVLRDRYPGIRVGWSTHEEPHNPIAVQLAIGCGATIFEKHVGVGLLNPYSAHPEQVFDWLMCAYQAFEMYGSDKIQFKRTEQENLQALRRGAFAKRDIRAGEKIVLSDVFFAIPVQDGQLVANNFSKYTEFYAENDISYKNPILYLDTKTVNIREGVRDIVKAVQSLIHKSGIILPTQIDLEISHHYGIESFWKYGLTMMIIINREYCKKVIVMLPGQEHPEQYHLAKEETFYIIWGSVLVSLDGKEKMCYPGDIVVIERGVKHKFSTISGVVFEEISSTHHIDDSYYTDPAIMSNPSRKTLLTDWIKNENI